MKHVRKELVELNGDNEIYSMMENRSYSLHRIWKDGCLKYITPEDIRMCVSTCRHRNPGGAEDLTVNRALAYADKMEKLFPKLCVKECGKLYDINEVNYKELLLSIEIKKDRGYERGIEGR